jgi:hypothetical protein
MSAYHVRKDTHGFQRLQPKNSFADLDSQSSTERTAMIDNLLPRDAPADENSAPATMFATHDVLAMNEQVAGNDGGWGDQRKSKGKIAIYVSLPVCYLYYDYTDCSCMSSGDCSTGARPAAGRASCAHTRTQDVSF